MTKFANDITLPLALQQDTTQNPTKGAEPSVTHSPSQALQK
jgi:hypothetical protein